MLWQGERPGAGETIGETVVSMAHHQLCSSGSGCLSQVPPIAGVSGREVRIVTLTSPSILPTNTSSSIGIRKDTLLRQGSHIAEQGAQRPENILDEPWTSEHTGQSSISPVGPSRFWGNHFVHPSLSDTDVKVTVRLPCSSGLFLPICYPSGSIGTWGSAH